MLDKLKVAAVLVLIGAISGFLIYSVNNMTKEDIQKNADVRAEMLFKEIFDLDESTEIDLDIVLLDGTIVKQVTVSEKGGDVLGVVYQGYDTNNYGDITVLVGVNSEGIIQNVAISESGNTVTFVKNIENNYLAPFANQDLSNVSYDTKTGSTYTYTSVSKIVNAVSVLYGGAE